MENPDNTQIHESLGEMKATLKTVAGDVAELKECLLDPGRVVETVNKHKTYWKIVGIVGKILLYAGTPAAIATAAYMTRG